MAEETVIGMGELSVKTAQHKLVCRGIGSCVVIALYDDGKKLGGMAHAMLPKQSAKKKFDQKSAKFVDVAIDILVSRMLRRGSSKRSIEAKIAGGANMFPSLIKTGEMVVGQRNVENAKKKLEQQGVKLVAEDVGGNHGRSISFDVGTGIVEVSIKI